jgi:polygalacturonase
MHRRGLLVSLLSLGLAQRSYAQSASWGAGGIRGANDSNAHPVAATPPLQKSGPVRSRQDGQVIENLDISSSSGAALAVSHHGVTIRNCRIRHEGGSGIHATGCNNLLLENLELEHTGAPAKGVGPNQDRNNIHLMECPGVRVARVRASRGSSNIYVERSPGAALSFLELYDARGPMPRGQNVQFNGSPRSLLEDFSAENGPTSWTEDNVSVFHSSDCTVRRGLVSYNNSPSGDGIMVEGSFNCLIEDVDAVQQGNGAFAAVTQENTGSGGCVFLRCRTRDSYNSARDGRAAPTSNGLSIYTLVSQGAAKHTIRDCVYYNLANPHNLVWNVDALAPGWSFTARDFTPRPPVRLRFSWDSVSAGSDAR